MNFDGRLFSFSITLANVMNVLADIIKDFGPDHKGVDDSAGCTYFVYENGVLKPVCIVGQFFHRIGLGLVVMDSSFSPWGNYPDQYGACNTNSGIWDRVAALGVTLEADAQTFLRMIQVEQDNKISWGLAFEAALEKFIAEKSQPINDAVQAVRSAIAFHTPEPLAPWEQELLNNDDLPF